MAGPGVGGGGQNVTRGAGRPVRVTKRITAVRNVTHGAVFAARVTKAVTVTGNVTRSESAGVRVTNPDERHAAGGTQPLPSRR